MADPSLYEYTDPRNEAAVVARWAPVLKDLGVQPLTVRDVPQTAQQLEIDGIPWNVEPLTTGEVTVPPTVFKRIHQMQEVGIPLAYWLSAEEQFPQPTFRLGEEREARPHTPTGGTRANEARRRPLAVPRPMRAIALPEHGDPLLLGVIPTAPYRGLWVVVGKWFH